MATANPVSFTMLDPSLAADQVALERNMALAQALRQQGMTPIDTSNRMAGTVMSRVSPFEGLAKMLQSYSANAWNSQNDSDRQALAQKQSSLLASLVGGSPVSPDVASTAALGTGAAQGDVGPTTSNATRMDNMQAGRGPLALTGDPGRDRLLMALNPEKYIDAKLSAYQATPSTQMATQAGVDPRAANAGALLKANSDPKVFGQQQAGLTPEQIRLGAYGEAAKAAEIERRGGNQFVNPMLGTSGIVPKIPENANPVGPVAPNGALPGGVAPIPGAAPIVQSNAQAGAYGSASGGFQNVTMPDGSQRPIRGAEVPSMAPQPGVTGNFVGDPAQVRAAIAGIKDPQERANAGAALQEQLARTPGVRLGQSTADKITQESGAKVLAELPLQLQQSKQTVTGLENAYKTIEAVGKSGPGISKTVDALSVLNSMGIPVAKGDVNGFQTLKKFLENSASSAAAANGFTGSDARFEQFKAGQPNAETMSPDALKGAIRYVLSQHDASIARAQFIQQQVQTNQGDPNAAMKAQQQWSQQFSPRVFEFSRMTPQERQEAVKGMDKPKLSQFRKQYDFAHEQGWVQ